MIKIHVLKIRHLNFKTLESYKVADTTNEQNHALTWERGNIYKKMKRKYKAKGIKGYVKNIKQNICSTVKHVDP